MVCPDDPNVSTDVVSFVVSLDVFVDGGLGQGIY